MPIVFQLFTNEGIVLSSDRIMTSNYHEQHGNETISQYGIFKSRYVQKIYPCPGIHAAIATCGPLIMNGSILSNKIHDMMKFITPDTKISQIPDIILDYFAQFSDRPDTMFTISGYENMIPKMYQVNILTKKKEENEINIPFAIWHGDTVPLARFVQPMAIKSRDGKYTDLPFDKVLWELFSLQDSIDFARFAVNYTEEYMRFKNVSENVGGGVDVLLITPTEMKWIQKAELH